MDIIYDPAKNRENIKKHGIDFADLTPVFYDDRTLGPIEDNDHAESRFVVIGLDALMRIVVVVYAYGGRHASYHLLATCPAPRNTPIPEVTHERRLRFRPRPARPGYPGHR